MDQDEINIKNVVDTNEDLMKKAEIQPIIDKLVAMKDHLPTYNEMLNAFPGTFEKALDDFQQKYILFKKYPDDPKNKPPFLTSLQNLKQIETSMGDLSDTVQKDTNSLTYLVGLVNSVLHLEKQDNVLLTQESKLSKQGIRESSVMIVDYVDEYKKIRLYLLLLMVATLFLFCFCLYKLYKLASVPADIQKMVKRMNPRPLAEQMFPK